jgi:Protein of unknown function (DUF3237)
MQLRPPALIHVADFKVTVSQPIDAGHVQGLTTSGRRRIIPITGGTVEGPMLKGKVLAAGADFQIVISETCTDLDARYMLQLDSGEHVFVQNRAIRRASAENIAKLLRGELVDPEQIYFRCVPTFEVSSPKLKWLTESVFVGTGARFPDHVLISVFSLD